MADIKTTKLKVVAMVK